MGPRSSFRLCQVHLLRDDPTETFARANAERSPCHVSVVHGEGGRPLYLDGKAIFSPRLGARVVRLPRRALWAWQGKDMEAELDSALYAAAFRRARCDAVLAEFGLAGVGAMDACRRLDLPLIVYFHGYDVYSRRVLDRYSDRYALLFTQAAALIAVSEPMREALIALGAPAGKTHFVRSGVDPCCFAAAAPERAPPVFLAVGRFVEKKAPQLTIAAFARVWRRYPEARLRMIGDGRLQGACFDLADGLGIGDAVTLLGEQPHERVAEEMRGARAFVQHSLVAQNGDSEGTPISIMEASASGLPVVSTRHGGIPDVVVDGETGFLVDEHDVEGMAERMERLLVDAALAAELGRAGRRRIEQHFTIDAKIDRLWEIVQDAARSSKAG